MRPMHVTSYLAWSFTFWPPQILWTCIQGDMAYYAMFSEEPWTESGRDWLQQRIVDPTNAGDPARQNWWEGPTSWAQQAVPLVGSLSLFRSIGAAAIWVSRYSSLPSVLLFLDAFCRTVETHL
ncbi:hypothetical protein ASPNIDRAFT_42452 [Aspergillus niger ATCC 1015]|uniref:Uncharacterized protein n=1 Tax=Aspergillus niger (strain ATCC 1015 / CBS 113.46 / FGSC A1144 / LSHB Ac4 / NCTC 3858a / NRRL 328 / USDA 3528.7) TaxID=380704 RepID=G3XVD6_ASPNA|nr:hypothetical protein ASPNIDRAFT_42452 [Aspergillus niger ATCC 1015]